MSDERKLILMPCTLREANQFVASFHRHNNSTAGGKFAIAVGSVAGGMAGVAIVGRPLARMLDDGFTAEVLRCCCRDDAPRNANSMLYGACWRAWRAMGGTKLVTYTLTTESGASLRGAGWRVVGESRGGSWSRANSGRLRDWQPICGQRKLRWEMAG